MPEPAHERLQPSLLDRLTDEDPSRATESRDRRVLSLARLRECVLRDLTWLFNTGGLGQRESLEEFPLVAASTLNYGVRDIAGTTISRPMLSEFERQVRRAIIDFEPRILPGTLRVRATAAEEEMNRRAVSFEIDGEMWAQPVPIRMLLKTDLDIETGTATVRESAGIPG